MAETFSNRLKSAWNAFMNRDPPNYKDLGMSYSYRPDRLRVMSGNEKTIITAIYNKMAMDCSAIEIIHAKLDENDRYVSPMSSGLNTCLT
uniref:Uncharacterized protein n=1 Tax=Siphoviridae sp. ctEYW18 TaxID=2826208 RepID=A0A8S5M8X8_9CAUD|nr:MAG TPA: hypothetical protein [Siphoviridae sp. ctEYW18]